LNFKIEQYRRDVCNVNGILSRMIRTNMKNEHIVEHLLILWSAGFEPIRITISWILAYLGQYPDALQKMIEEINYVYTHKDSDNDKNDSENKNVIIWRQLKKLKYTTQVINEVLRLKPPATYVTFGINKLNEENKKNKGYKINDKYTIPLNWRITCCWTGIFYNQQYYNNPFNFDPDRFNDGKTYYFTPFAGGVRTCPGRYLTYFEIKLFLFYLFSHYKINIISSIESNDFIDDKPQISPKILSIQLLS